MSLAQERITELFTEIHHLRAGATESEIIVREITRDIRNLDLAKKNITNSITGIKRFQMLVVAYEQLRKLANANSAAARATTAAALPSSAAPSSEPIAESRRYKEAAQALSAVKELANHFRTYSSIERISTVLRGIQEIQGTLRSQVMKDFEMRWGLPALCLPGFRRQKRLTIRIFDAPLQSWQGPRGTRQREPGHSCSRRRLPRHRSDR
jgi:hypothetical protein